MIKANILREDNPVIFLNNSMNRHKMIRSFHKLVNRILTMKKIKKWVDGLKKNMKDFWRQCESMVRIGIGLRSML